MRFKTSVRNIQTFTKFVASLSSIGKLAWVQLDNTHARFTIIPEVGSQVWAVLSIDSIFEDYTIASQAENNTINLELPLLPLQRALKSALSAISASLRLTKADGVPVLCLTVTTNHTAASLTGRAANAHGIGSVPPDVLFGGMDDEYFREESLEPNLLAGGRFGGGLNGGEQRETTVVHNIPIRVLSQASVEQIHQPKVREPDAHVLLPPLLQLKSISDRFTKLALATASGASASAATIAGSGLSNAHVPKLELSANMHGNLKLSIRTDALDICSSWTGLTNPALEPDQVDGGEEGVRNHPSTVLQERGPDAWATVRIDGRDWGRVLSVGRMGGRVIACFVDDHALILYVYLSSHDDSMEDSVLTVRSLRAFRFGKTLRDY